jgi:uncharacterized protein involved in response to NO
METVMQTRGEQMLALRRARMAAAPPVLRGGFRPFFLSGAIWAVVALSLWLASLTGLMTIPSAFDALAWHRHEMIFGFVGSVIAGFLLTAIPNWTGRLPIAGMPLASLFGLWFAGRLAMLFSAMLGLAVAAVIDVGFYLVLGAIAAREVIQANNRNVPVVGLVLLIGIANALDHLAAAGMFVDPALPWQLAVALVTLMISLIGGRIIPSFTRNWLVKQGITNGLPGQPNRFDLLVIGLTGLGASRLDRRAFGLAAGLAPRRCRGGAGNPARKVEGLDDRPRSARPRPACRLCMGAGRPRPAGRGPAWRTASPDPPRSMR